MLTNEELRTAIKEAHWLTQNISSPQALYDVAVKHLQELLTEQLKRAKESA